MKERNIIDNKVEASAKQAAFKDIFENFKKAQLQLEKILEVHYCQCKSPDFFFFQRNNGHQSSIHCKKCGCLFPYSEDEGNLQICHIDTKVVRIGIEE